MSFRVERTTAFVCAALAALFFASCTKEEPVRLGFVGGLTGRVADLGQSGQKGATMAVDDRNARGGLGGRRIELLVGDDRQDPAAAVAAVNDLLEKKVVCLVGHMTSAMSLVGVKIADERKIPLVSPSTTTTELSGRDDHFFRVISTTLEYGSNMAAYLSDKRGLKRVVLVYDLGNRAYTETWCDHFEAAFKSLGGEVVARKTFTSRPGVQFGELAKAVAAEKPEAVVLAASAMDTAMFCQQLRKIDGVVAAASAEWASTEKLLELGGKAVEGMVLSQYFDREDKTPAYVAFRAAYKERYREEPGFAATSAYDAVTVALDAVNARIGDEPLKNAILRVGTFEGLQGPFTLDAYGDTARKSVIVEVAGGKFKKVQ